MVVKVYFDVQYTDAATDAKLKQDPNTKRESLPRLLAPVHPEARPPLCCVTYTQEQNTDMCYSSLW